MSSIIDLPTAVAMGPGSILSDDGRFVLHNQNIYALQRYVQTALALPTDEATFRASIHAPANADVSDFARLITCYAGFKRICTKFSTETYPMMVRLASDVVQYGKTANSVYQPLRPLLPRMKQGDEAARNEFKALVLTLKDTAQRYAERATACETQLAEFQTASETEQGTLTTLHKDYQTRLGALAPETEKLIKSIAQSAELIKSLTREYEHNVVVAATTPTYWWVPVAGWIAGPVVAGVFGDRATKALNSLRETEARLANDIAKRDANAAVLVKLEFVVSDVTKLTDVVKQGLTALRAIRTRWTEVSHALGDVVDTIEVRLEKAIPNVVEQAINDAIRDWKDAADKAELFRASAYVQLQQAA